MNTIKITRDAFKEATEYGLKVRFIAEEPHQQKFVDEFNKMTPQERYHDIVRSFTVYGDILGDTFKNNIQSRRICLQLACEFSQRKNAEEIVKMAKMFEEFLDNGYARINPLGIRADDDKAESK
jgi:hypothetical protein